jgi:hypothetical protein
MNVVFNRLAAVSSSLLLCHCTGTTAVVKGDLSNKPKVIARQSADADARWAEREQARDTLDAGPSGITPATQGFYDKGYASGLRDHRAGRGRDPFREDEGGTDKAMLAAFGQGYDAGYDAR